MGANEMLRELIEAIKELTAAVVRLTWVEEDWANWVRLKEADKADKEEASDEST